MQCNTCESELTLFIPELDLLGCKTCNLLWFTQGQFKKINVITEPLLDDFSAQEKCNTIEKGEKCPQCDIVLHFHKFSTNPNVSYAECYKCSGAYLNSHQLKEIKENSMNAEQLEAYKQSLAHSVEGFTQAEDIKSTRQGKGKFARMWSKYRIWDKSEEKKK